MEYTINEENIDRQRLLARILAPLTDKLLSQFDLPKGSRGLDIGCGIGETTELLATKLGTFSKVIGIDQDPGLVEEAKKRSNGSDADLEFQVGNATDLVFDDNSFDFVHTRYLLIHIPNPVDVVKEMVRVCKPGGVVAILEPDLTGHITYPENWAIDKVMEMTGPLFANALVGRRLHTLFQQVGYPTVNMSVNTITSFDQEDMLRFWRLSGEALAPALVAKGILTQQEAEELVLELRLQEEQKELLFVSAPHFSEWVVCV